MEKISRIVAGSQRVASVDLKNAAAVRPGTPSFGRPIGISHGDEPDARTTAQKAIEIFNQREDKKATEARDTQMVRTMASNFFMSHVPGSPAQESVPEAVNVGQDSGVDIGEEEPPTKYTPRGSYVDVRA
jgi:hypothetical protein